MIPLGKNEEKKINHTLIGRVMDSYDEIERGKCAEGYILLSPKFSEPWIVDEEHMKPIVEFLERPYVKCTSDDLCMLFEEKSTLEIGMSGYAYGTIIIAKDYENHIGPLNREDIKLAKKYINQMKRKAFIDGKPLDIYKYYEIIKIEIGRDDGDWED